MFYILENIDKLFKKINIMFLVIISLLSINKKENSYLYYSLK